MDFETDSAKNALAEARERRVTREHELIDALHLMTRIGPAAASAGVYMLLSENGEIVYVGQSKNVASRMRGHAGKEYRDIKMIPVESDRARDRLEMLLIGVFKPKYNVTYK